MSGEAAVVPVAGVRFDPDLLVGTTRDAVASCSGELVAVRAEDDRDDIVVRWTKGGGEAARLRGLAFGCRRVQWAWDGRGREALVLDTGDTAVRYCVFMTSARQTPLHCAAAARGVVAVAAAAAAPARVDTAHLPAPPAGGVKAHEASLVYLVRGGDAAAHTSSSSRGDPAGPLRLRRRCLTLCVTRLLHAAGPAPATGAHELPVHPDDTAVIAKRVEKKRGRSNSASNAGGSGSGGGAPAPPSGSATLLSWDVTATMVAALFAVDRGAGAAALHPAHPQHTMLLYVWHWVDQGDGGGGGAGSVATGGDPTPPLLRPAAAAALRQPGAPSVGGSTAVPAAEATQRYQVLLRLVLPFGGGASASDVAAPSTTPEPAFTPPRGCVTLSAWCLFVTVGDDGFSVDLAKAKSHADERLQASAGPAGVLTPVQTAAQSSVGLSGVSVMGQSALNANPHPAFHTGMSVVAGSSPRNIGCAGTRPALPSVCMSDPPSGNAADPRRFGAHRMSAAPQSRTPKALPDTPEQYLEPLHSVGGSVMSGAATTVGYEGAGDSFSCGDTGGGGVGGSFAARSSLLRVPTRRRGRPPQPATLTNTTTLDAYGVVRLPRGLAAGGYVNVTCAVTSDHVIVVHDAAVGAATTLAAASPTTAVGEELGGGGAAATGTGVFAGLGLHGDRVVAPLPHAESPRTHPSTTHGPPPSPAAGDDDAYAAIEEEGAEGGARPTGAPLTPPRRRRRLLWIANIRELRWHVLDWSGCGLVFTEGTGVQGVPVLMLPDGTAPGEGGFGAIDTAPGTVLLPIPSDSALTVLTTTALVGYRDAAALNACVPAVPRMPPGSDTDDAAGALHSSVISGGGVAEASAGSRAFAEMWVDAAFASRDARALGEALQHALEHLPTAACYSIARGVVNKLIACSKREADNVPQFFPVIAPFAIDVLARDGRADVVVDLRKLHVLLEPSARPKDPPDAMRRVWQGEGDPFAADTALDSSAAGECEGNPTTPRTPHQPGEGGSRLDAMMGDPAQRQGSLAAATGSGAATILSQRLMAAGVEAQHSIITDGNDDDDDDDDDDDSHSDGSRNPTSSPHTRHKVAQYLQDMNNVSGVSGAGGSGGRGKKRAGVDGMPPHETCRKGSVFAIPTDAACEGIQTIDAFRICLVETATRYGVGTVLASLNARPPPPHLLKWLEGRAVDGGWVEARGERGQKAPTQQQQQQSASQPPRPNALSDTDSGSGGSASGAGGDGSETSSNFSGSSDSAAGAWSPWTYGKLRAALAVTAAELLLAGETQSGVRLLQHISDASGPASWKAVLSYFATHTLNASVRRRLLSAFPRVVGLTDAERASADFLREIETLLEEAPGRFGGGSIPYSTARHAVTSVAATGPLVYPTSFNPVPAAYHPDAIRVGGAQAAPQEPPMELEAGDVTDFGITFASWGFQPHMHPRTSSPREPGGGGMHAPQQNHLPRRHSSGARGGGGSLPSLPSVDRLSALSATPEGSGGEGAVARRTLSTGSVSGGGGGRCGIRGFFTQISIAWGMVWGYEERKLAVYDAASLAGQAEVLPTLVTSAWDGDILLRWVVRHHDVAGALKLFPFLCHRYPGIEFPAVADGSGVDVTPTSSFNAPPRLSTAHGHPAPLSGPDTPLELGLLGVAVGAADGGAGDRRTLEVLTDSTQLFRLIFDVAKAYVVGPSAFEAAPQRAVRALALCGMLYGGQGKLPAAFGSWGTAQPLPQHKTRQGALRSAMWTKKEGGTPTKSTMATATATADGGDVHDANDCKSGGRGNGYSTSNNTPATESESTSPAASSNATRVAFTEICPLTPQEKLHHEVITHLVTLPSLALVAYAEHHKAWGVLWHTRPRGVTMPALLFAAHRRDTHSSLYDVALLSEAHYLGLTPRPLPGPPVTLTDIFRHGTSPLGGLVALAYSGKTVQECLNASPTEASHYLDAEVFKSSLRSSPALLSALFPSTLTVSGIKSEADAEDDACADTAGAVAPVDVVSPRAHEEQLRKKLVVAQQLEAENGRVMDLDAATTEGDTTLCTAFITAHRNALDLSSVLRTDRVPIAKYPIIPARLGPVTACSPHKPAGAHDDLVPIPDFTDALIPVGTLGDGAGDPNEARPPPPPPLAAAFDPTVDDHEKRGGTGDPEVDASAVRRLSISDSCDGTGTGTPAADASPAADGAATTEETLCTRVGDWLDWLGAPAAADVAQETDGRSDASPTPATAAGGGGDSNASNAVPRSRSGTSLGGSMCAPAAGSMPAMASAYAHACNDGEGTLDLEYYLTRARPAAALQHITGYVRNPFAVLTPLRVVLDRVVREGCEPPTGGQAAAPTPSLSQSADHHRRRCFIIQEVACGRGFVDAVAREVAQVLAKGAEGADGDREALDDAWAAHTRRWSAFAAAHIRTATNVATAHHGCDTTVTACLVVVAALGGCPQRVATDVLALRRMLDGGHLQVPPQTVLDAFTVFSEDVPFAASPPTAHPPAPTRALAPHVLAAAEQMLFLLASVTAVMAEDVADGAEDERAMAALAAATGAGSAAGATGQKVPGVGAKVNVGDGTSPEMQAALNLAATWLDDARPRTLVGLPSSSGSLWALVNDFSLSHGLGLYTEHLETFTRAGDWASLLAEAKVLGMDATALYDFLCTVRMRPAAGSGGVRLGDTHNAADDGGGSGVCASPLADVSGDTSWVRADADLADATLDVDATASDCGDAVEGQQAAMDHLLLALQRAAGERGEATTPAATPTEYYHVTEARFVRGGDGAAADGGSAASTPPVTTITNPGGVCDHLRPEGGRYTRVMGSLYHALTLPDGGRIVEAVVEVGRGRSPSPATPAAAALPPHGHALPPRAARSRSASPEGPAHDGEGWGCDARVAHDDGSPRPGFPEMIAADVPIPAVTPAFPRGLALLDSGAGLGFGAAAAWDAGVAAVRVPQAVGYLLEQAIALRVPALAVFAAAVVERRRGAPGGEAGAGETTGKLNPAGDHEAALAAYACLGAWIAASTRGPPHSRPGGVDDGTSPVAAADDASSDAEGDDMPASASDVHPQLSRSRSRSSRSSSPAAGSALLRVLSGDARTCAALDVDPTATNAAMRSLGTGGSGADYYMSDSVVPDANADADANADTTVLLDHRFTPTAVIEAVVRVCVGAVRVLEAEDAAATGGAVLEAAAGGEGCVKRVDVLRGFEVFRPASPLRGAVAVCHAVAQRRWDTIPDAVRQMRRAATADAIDAEDTTHPATAAREAAVCDAILCWVVSNVPWWAVVRVTHAFEAGGWEPSSYGFCSAEALRMLTATHPSPAPMRMLRRPTIAEGVRVLSDARKFRVAREIVGGSLRVLGDGGDAADSPATPRLGLVRRALLDIRSVVTLEEAAHQSIGALLHCKWLLTNPRALESLLKQAVGLCSRHALSDGATALLLLASAASTLHFFFPKSKPAVAPLSARITIPPRAAAARSAVTGALALAYNVLWHKAGHLSVLRVAQVAVREVNTLYRNENATLRVVQDLLDIRMAEAEDVYCHLGRGEGIRCSSMFLITKAVDAVVASGSAGASRELRGALRTTNAVVAKLFPGVSQRSKSGVVLTPVRELTLSGVRCLANAAQECGGVALEWVPSVDQIQAASPVRGPLRGDVAAPAAAKDAKPRRPRPSSVPPDPTHAATGVKEDATDNTSSKTKPEGNPVEKNTAAEDAMPQLKQPRPAGARRTRSSTGRTDARGGAGPRRGDAVDVARDEPAGATPASPKGMNAAALAASERFSAVGDVVLSTLAEDVAAGRVALDSKEIPDVLWAAMDALADDVPSRTPAAGGTTSRDSAPRGRDKHARKDAGTAGGSAGSAGGGARGLGAAAMPKSEVLKAKGSSDAHAVLGVLACISQHTQTVKARRLCERLKVLVKLAVHTDTNVGYLSRLTSRQLVARCLRWDPMQPAVAAAAAAAGSTRQTQQAPPPLASMEFAITSPPHPEWEDAVSLCREILKVFDVPVNDAARAVADAIMASCYAPMALEACRTKTLTVVISDYITAAASGVVDSNTPDGVGFMDTRCDSPIRSASDCVATATKADRDVMRQGLVDAARRAYGEYFSAPWLPPPVEGQVGWRAQSMSPLLDDIPESVTPPAAAAGAPAFRVHSGVAGAGAGQGFRASLTTASDHDRSYGSLSAAVTRDGAIALAREQLPQFRRGGAGGDDRAFAPAQRAPSLPQPTDSPASAAAAPIRQRFSFLSDHSGITDRSGRGIPCHAGVQTLASGGGGLAKHHLLAMAELCGGAGQVVVGRCLLEVTDIAARRLLGRDAGLGGEDADTGAGVGDTHSGYSGVTSQGVAAGGPPSHWRRIVAVEPTAAALVHAAWLVSVDYDQALSENLKQRIQTFIDSCAQVSEFRALAPLLHCAAAVPGIVERLVPLLLSRGAADAVAAVFKYKPHAWGEAEVSLYTHIQNRVRGVTHRELMLEVQKKVGMALEAADLLEAEAHVKIQDAVEIGRQLGVRRLQRDSKKDKRDKGRLGGEWGDARGGVGGTPRGALNSPRRRRPETHDDMLREQSHPLRKAEALLAEAAQHYLRAGSCDAVRRCLNLYRLVNLQAQHLIPDLQLVSLSQTGARSVLVDIPSFADAEVVASSYDINKATEWLVPVYTQVALAGNTRYWDEFTAGMPYMRELYVELVQMFVTQRHTSVERERLALALQDCRDRTFVESSLKAIKEAAAEHVH